MTLILTLLAIFALLVGSEVWWRRQGSRDELSRKFIHITVGSFAAFWPFYLSWVQIVFLSISFVIVVVVSKYFNIFQAIHAVERPTWGEVCFAVAVGLLAYITHEPWVYTVALLHMSLADGMAAIVGVGLPTNIHYKVFGHTKSLAGSATFFGISLVLLLGFSLLVSPLGAGLIFGLAAGTTLLENIAVYGLDNLLVPLVVGGVLNSVVL